MYYNVCICGALVRLITQYIHDWVTGCDSQLFSVFQVGTSNFPYESAFLFQNPRLQSATEKSLNLHLSGLFCPNVLACLNWPSILFLVTWFIRSGG